jgi:hypothetical protein
VGQAKRAERSGLPRFFFGYFLCIMTKKVTKEKCRNSGKTGKLKVKGSGFKRDYHIAESKHKRGNENSLNKIQNVLIAQRIHILK